MNKIEKISNMNCLSLDIKNNNFSFTEKKKETPNNLEENNEFEDIFKECLKGYTK